MGIFLSNTQGLHHALFMKKAGNNVPCFFDLMKLTIQLGFCAGVIVRISVRCPSLLFDIELIAVAVLIYLELAHNLFRFPIVFHIAAKTHIGFEGFISLGKLANAAVANSLLVDPLAAPNGFGVIVEQVLISFNCLFKLPVQLI